MPILWKQLLMFAPQIIEVSRELLKRARRPPAAQQPAAAVDPDDLPQRVAALEENERRQAELVEKMASQLAELSRAVVVLHQRQRMLIGAIAILAGLLLWKIFRG